jgi:hypothetical protein
MTLKEMNAIVSEELKHIPDGPEPQNMLRFAYSAGRKNSLGKNARGQKSREDVLRESIAIVKNQVPTWAEQFDREFFKL